MSSEKGPKYINAQEHKLYTRNTRILFHKAHLLKSIGAVTRAALLKGGSRVKGEGEGCLKGEGYFFCFSNFIET